MVSQTVKTAVEKGTSSGVATHGVDKNVLRYPLDLTADDTNEVMRFNIKTRDKLSENQQTIYLYTPQGISLADSASYNAQETGFIGGLAQTGSTGMKAVIGEGGGWLAQAEAAKDALGGWIGIGKSAALATSNKINTKIGDTATMGSGMASNPHTNIQFSGVGMRSFTFTYKLVAQSADEAEEIRSIENTFRKFLYPVAEPAGMVLRYPPYWQIQFLKFGASEMEENKFLPFIDLCYLRNLSCTYNASSNAFHKDGVPVELDLSLSFDEAQQNTRGDLYKDKKDYNSAEYTYGRGALPDIFGQAESAVENLGGE
jgi:hypothetical protein